MQIKTMPVFAVLSMVISVIAFLTCDVCAVFITAFLLVCLLFLFNKSKILLFFVASLIVLSSIFSVTAVNNYKRADNSVVSAKYVVLEEPEKQEFGYSVLIRVTSKNLPYNSKIKLYSYQKLNPGNIYSGQLLIRAVKHNKAHYYSENIFATSTPKSKPQKQGTNNFYLQLNNMRNNITKALYRNLSTDCAATLNALTVGERKGFSDDFAESVRRAGVSHIMVVSGMHLAIIMGFVTVLFGKIFDNKYLRALCALITVFGLSALCGFTVSILRAGITYVFMALSPLSDRNGNAFSNLCASVTLILIISPFAFFSISFQLSVLSTYGILVFSPKIMKAYKMITRKNYKFYRYSKGIVGILAQTLSATFLTTPVVVYHFSQFSAIAPVTNLLISQAVSVNLVICATALLFEFMPIFSVFANPLFFAAEKLTQYINYIILTFGNYRFSSVEVDSKAAVILAVPVIIALFIFQFSKYYICRKQVRKVKSSQVKGVLLCR